MTQPYEEATSARRQA